MNELKIPGYRLYVDESGDHTYKDIEKSDKRYLGITGCAISQEYYRTVFQPEFESLKQKHFPHNPDEPVIFHRKEIINKSGRFWRLRDPQKEQIFNSDLLQFFDKMEYFLITVIIDKKNHIERYGKAAMHPYHFCLVALIERFVGLMSYLNCKGDVLAECRGGVEDMQLKDAYEKIYNDGTLYWKPDRFRNILTSKEIKLKPKSSNIAGTQVADLIAHPSKQQILYEKRLIDEYKENFGYKIAQIIEKKYNRQFYQDRVEGYGKVLIL